MNLQTFRAPTMAECLSEVKRVMGTDAVILHTRTYVLRRWLGFRRREMVEITAGRGRTNGGRSRRLVGRPPMLMETPPPSQMLPQPQEVATRVATLEPAVHGAAIGELTRDVGRLSTLVGKLAVQIQKQEAPEIPGELLDEYTLLIENQVERDTAEEIIKHIHRTLRPDHLAQKQFVHEKIAEHLEKLIPTAGPIVRSKTAGPHVVALIGPTGVGKTTTIAKLAAKLQFDEKHRVGLITLDTYRIAAIDQLRKYADIIGSPLRVAGTPEDLRDTIASMSDFDYILIDTAGRSPKDKLKLNELKTFLEAAQPEEVHLVLSTTASPECAELAIDRFADVRVDKLIFTKLDEAQHVGSVLNIVRTVGRSLSYVTTGQDVPADIEVARGRRLAQLILGSEL